MNYFAHGRDYLDDPYFLAGTATPDWLSVAARSIRTPSKAAKRFATHADPHLAAVARGVVQHHFDDAWFHQTRAFFELSLQLSAAVRQRLGEADGGARGGFLGHILVEVLLDAELIDEAPQRLDAYYAALDAADPLVVEQAVCQIANGRCDTLAAFIRRFSAERFLYDYADDNRLLWRLGYVMGRLQLPPLPPALREVLPDARRLVRQRKVELLAGSIQQHPQMARFTEGEA